MTDSKIYNPLGISDSARRGEVTTAHGKFQTPAFMPVGTSGAVKAMTSGDLEECGAEIILGNTYHLYLRPGTKIIKNQGGLASFNAWNKPTLTDSGGFQVFSLQDLSKISDEGVEFRSHHDGSKHMFTPAKVMEIQHDIGADIIMAFDQCVPNPADHKLAEEGVRRTYDWAKICVTRHNELNDARESDKAEFANDASRRNRPGLDHKLRLFGIVQGSVYKDLRTKSAEQLISLDFPGYAIGGLAVGESKEEMEEMLAHTVPLLPKDKPRYLMGVGYPEDILMAVSYGIDMFDCVLPTRNARTGYVFTSEGPLIYRNAENADDSRPLDPNCDCKVCRRYSRAYIRHMYNQSEITGMVLASYHSTYFFQKLMQGIRLAIEENRFDSFRKDFLSRYKSR